MPSPELHPLFIKSLARGLSVLEAFSSQRPSLTLTELAQVSGLNLAAVQRCVHTLLALGYLQRGERKEYSLGARVLTLGYSCLQGSELRKMAESHLRRFSEQIKATVNLSVLDDTEVLVLFRNEVQRFFKFDLQPGSKLPSYCTSMGKVLLAALPETELRSRVARIKLERMTPYTITDPRKLLRELLRVRRQGMAESDKEASLALYSLAVPLLDHRRKVVAAVNISLPLIQDGRQARTRLSRLLVEQGRNLSSLLGYEGPYPLIPGQAAALER
ncbi:MAG: IclR family transcriptional regulator C-terminal domain-containing protein [Thermodesulfobacteriota bacterium]